MWCIPPKQSAEFVCHMEDVLEVYCRPYNPKRPVVCLDETFRQLIGEVREPLPPAPGRVERHDSVYVRNGTASLFLAFEPLAGWRHVAVSDSRKRGDWARFVKMLLEGRYREAERIILVMDQLNTHSLASLYEAFPPDEARRASPSGWRSITRPNMARGSTWPRSSSVRWGATCRSGWRTGR
jgi:DDE superfamily endonuclease